MLFLTQQRPHYDQSRGHLWSVEALIPTCQAQDVILSRSRDTYVIGAQPHFGRLARWISLHRTITYIHGGYNNTYKSHEYHNINTRHPTTDAKMKSTKTSICYPRLPTRNQTQDWRRRRRKNSNTTTSLSRQVIGKPAPATVVVVSVSHEDSAIP